MEELQVVTTLAVLQHLMKSVVDFKDSLDDFLFIPITAVEAI
jgi:predicted transcriptional regulator